MSSSGLRKAASVSTPRSDGKLTQRSSITTTRDSDRSSLSRISSLSIHSSSSSSSSLHSSLKSSTSQRAKSPIPPTPPNNTHHPPDNNVTAEGELQALRLENKKLAQQKLALANKLVLMEEKVKNDQKKIQTLELVLQREASTPTPPSSSSSSPKSGRVADNKFLAEIDALSSKVFKLEEKNQSMSEELNMLKSDLRNKRKEHEAKIRELQLKHDFDIRTLEQQQRDFASGLKKETRKENDGLKQHLVVQETDLQKKHLRDMQDLRSENLERELQLKEVIHRLQDELEKYKQAAKRAAIRRVEFSLDADFDDDGDAYAEDLSVEEPGFEDEDEEQGDPGECY